MTYEHVRQSKKKHKTTSDENDKMYTKQREKVIHQIIIIISQPQENHRRVSICVLGLFLSVNS